MNLKNMLAFDHPLNSTGVAQAEDLQRRWAAAASASASPLIDMAPDGDDSSMLREFLDAGCVLVSPFTRAVQTAVVGLHLHPTVMHRGVRLLAAAREVKATLGGLDSVGRACGAAIAARAHEELAREGGVVAAERWLAGVQVDHTDVCTDWWTCEREAETDAEVRVWCRSSVSGEMPSHPEESQRRA